MKSTNIVRKVDTLGRIVVPVELRRKLGLEPHSQIEIFSNKNGICVRKFKTTCTFCESTNIKAEYKNYKICKDCYEKIIEAEKK